MQDYMQWLLCIQFIVCTLNDTEDHDTRHGAQQWDGATRIGCTVLDAAGALLKFTTSKCL